MKAVFAQWKSTVATVVFLIPIYMITDQWIKTLGVDWWLGLAIQFAMVLYIGLICGIFLIKMDYLREENRGATMFIDRQRAMLMRYREAFGELPPENPNAVVADDQGDDD